MRKSTITVSLLSMALASMAFAGCTPETTSGPASMSVALNAAGAKAAVERPFSADCVLEGEFIGPVAQRVKGTCQITHLGRATVRFIETVNFLTGAFESRPVFVAANGDELHVHLMGLATPSFENGIPTGLTLLGSAVVEGGTGRFANATGQLAQSGVVRFGPSNTATDHLEGRLSY